MLRVTVPEKVARLVPRCKAERNTHRLAFSAPLAD